MAFIPKPFKSNTRANCVGNPEQMITCVSAELTLPGSGFSGRPEILSVVTSLKSSATDGDAKRSFRSRLGLRTFLSVKFLKSSIAFVLRGQYIARL